MNTNFITMFKGQQTRLNQGHVRHIGLFQKKSTPPPPTEGRKAQFFDPPPPYTWISKTAWGPLPSGFPSSKTPHSIWISIKLLDTVILIYTQCTRIRLGT